VNETRNPVTYAYICSGISDEIISAIDKSLLKNVTEIKSPYRNIRSQNHLTLKNRYFYNIYVSISSDSKRHRHYSNMDALLSSGLILSSKVIKKNDKIT